MKRDWKRLTKKNCIQFQHDNLHLLLHLSYLSPQKVSTEVGSFITNKTVALKNRWDYLLGGAISSMDSSRFCIGKTP